ncbi:MAG: glycosyltransferase family 2 protein [Kiritimatiellia bacterium]
MSAHNAGRYLNQCLKSLIRQTFRDFECIVVDDGSTDNTAHILRDHMRADERVRVLWNTIPQGLTPNLNRAIREAAGPFLARMDADDVARPDRFAKQVAFLERHPECVAVGGQVVFVDEDGDLLCEFSVPCEHEQIEERLWRGDSLALVHPCVMMRTDAVRAVGSYRAKAGASEDLDLYLRLAEKGRLANLPDCLLEVRRHPDSVTAVGSAESERSRKLAILYEAAERRGLVGRRIELGEFPVVRSRAAWHAEWAFRIWKRGGNLRVARKHLWRALRSNPFARPVWRAFVCVLLRSKPVPTALSRQTV